MVYISLNLPEKKNEISKLILYIYNIFSHCQYISVIIKKKNVYWVNETFR